MRIYEKKEVVRVEKTLKTIKCDECKSDINETDIDHYYNVGTSHALWGNDSIDSHETLDFCSWVCLTNNMGKYFAEASDTYNYDVTRMVKDKYY